MSFLQLLPNILQKIHKGVMHLSLRAMEDFYNCNALSDYVWSSRRRGRLFCLVSVHLLKQALCCKSAMNTNCL